MPTRRRFLQASGAALGAALGVIGSVRASQQAAANHAGHAWTAVTTPTERTLTDVIHAGDRGYAVGGGGVVLERIDGEWRTVLESGPDGDGSNLAGVDTTADGRRVWFVGASGTIGAFHVESGTVTSHTAPDGVTNAFTDVAVAGQAGDATVYVTDATGTVHVSFASGDDGTWTHHTPGSGAAIRAIDCFDARRGVLVDGNQAVFRTRDGTSWTKIGIADANHSLAAVDADGPQTIRVVGGGGAVYQRTERGWSVATPIGTALRDVGVAPCGCVFAVGGGGTVLHYRPGPGMMGMADASNMRYKNRTGWHRCPTPTGQNLHAVSLRHPHIAVGAAGTILER